MRTSKKCTQYGIENPYCVVCGSHIIQVHHIKTRGAGGNDDGENLLSLCIAHHSELHTIGRYTFAEKYRIVKLLGNKNWRKRNGFEY